jgi:hypothetical protein
VYRFFYSPESSSLYFSTARLPAERLFSGSRNVFVCGALQDPVKMSALLGAEPFFAPAVATGFARSVESIAGEEIPFMVPDRDDPHGVLTGAVWLDLTEGNLERIESLELDRGFRKRIRIEARIGERRISAFTYVKR